MKASGLAGCVFSVSIALAACNGSPEGTVGETGDFDFRPEDTSPGPAATSGTDDLAISQEAEVGETLPDGASPLALVGAIGVISLMGAATARFLQRR